MLTQAHPVHIHEGGYFSSSLFSKGNGKLTRKLIFFFKKKSNNKEHQRKDKSDGKQMEILELLRLCSTIGSEPPGNHGNIGNNTN